MAVSHGIVYVATGRRYVNEAIASARSAKACMPQVHVTLFTDLVDTNEPCFDRVERIGDPRHSYRDKIPPLRRSPYERTLFLDSDTYLSSACDDLFDLLDRFDLAVAHDTWRLGHPAPGCPDAFVEMNTGVLAFRSSRAVLDLFDRWTSIYDTQLRDDPATPNDQSAFRMALYSSNVSFYVLPSDNNYTVWCPGFVGARGTVRILHGRNGRLPEAARWINASDEARAFLPSMEFMTPAKFGVLTDRGQRFVPRLDWILRWYRKIR